MVGGTKSLFRFFHLGACVLNRPSVCSVVKSFHLVVWFSQSLPLLSCATAKVKHLHSVSEQPLSINLSHREMELFFLNFSKFWTCYWHCAATYANNNYLQIPWYFCLVLFCLPSFSPNWLQQVVGLVLAHRTHLVVGVFCFLCIVVQSLPYHIKCFM